jgi:hypothetical protein
MRCTLDFRGGAWFVALALALPLACSDDGVPQDDTGSGVTGNEASATETNPTTDDPSTTSPSGTMTSTTDSSTTDPSTDTMPTTSPTDTTDDPSGSSSSADSSGTGTDTSGSSDGSSSESGSSESSSGEDTNGVLPTGADCVEDNDCESGVCWDFSDYDQFCFGAACSVECASDDECVEAFEAAGAQDPESSFCGDDGRCWVVGTGFGAFACAMEPAALLGR